MEAKEVVEVVVGSLSEHKLEAVVWALRELQVGFRLVGCKVASAVNDQPFGVQETTDGAIARAERAKEAMPGARLYVGIESGLVRAGGLTYFDQTAIAVYDVELDHCFLALSGGHEVPYKYVKAADRKGFKTATAGAEMAADVGCDPTDGSAFVTGGAVTRSSAMALGAKIALGQWVNREACKALRGSS